MCNTFWMNIIIHAGLSEPPSSVACFRDVTLYSSCFMKADVLVECRKSMIDVYYKWLKAHGAYDFVEEIVKPKQEIGFRIGYEGSNLMVDRITASNLNYIVSTIRRLSANQ